MFLFMASFQSPQQKKSVKKISKSSVSTEKPLAINYDPTVVNNDSSSEPLDYSLNIDADHFDINLSEGSFGPIVTVPSNWFNWKYCSVGGTGWVAFLDVNHDVLAGPFGLSKNIMESRCFPFLFCGYHTTTSFRLQGRGKIRFFSVHGLCSGK